MKGNVKVALHEVTVNDAKIIEASTHGAQYSQTFEDKVGKRRSTKH